MAYQAALPQKGVVLLAEDVDRNSAGTPGGVWQGVVLLAEDVDRNKMDGTGAILPSQSSSSRRTWIEIPCTLAVMLLVLVVLLAEDVDRNPQRRLRRAKTLRRPPRGGRG